jgi:hypothetical protein
MMSHGMEHGGKTEGPAGELGERESLLDVLRRRYALGEITQDQLEEMKAVLGLSHGKAVGAASGRSNPWEAEHHG